MDHENLLSLSEIARGAKYPLDAFHFVRRGLDFTVQRLFKNPETLTESERHVSGQQLSQGLKDFAVEEYGMLARTVLRRWQIRRTEDFGAIVFAMVDAGWMQATPADSRTDFVAVFDFDQAFDVSIRVDHIAADANDADLAEKG